MINAEMFLIEDLKNPVMKPMRDGYGEALAELGKKNNDVIVLCTDLTESTRTDIFKNDFPERFWEMGIAEQNMMGVAAGMALSGKIPFVNSFACFSPGRNWEQMKIAVALSKTNVKVVGSHAGLGNGGDGANQQSFEDIALARVIPNMTVVVPADYEQMKKAVMAIAEFRGPVYLRMTKPSRPVVTTKMTPFSLGSAQVLRSGKDVSVFACGMMVAEALAAAEELADKIEVEVVNVHTIKPLDRETLVASAKKTKKVVTAEEHQIAGGLGGAVAELLSEFMPVPMRRVGMRDVFGESGETGELARKFNLTKEEIIRMIREWTT